MTAQPQSFDDMYTRSFFRGRALPLLLSFVFVAVLTVYYWTLLPIGTIRHGDEYLTLDRSHSFVIRNDYLTVFTSNRPSFKKPPLQYWISAALMRQGADLEFALRFPALLFGILTLLSAGLLAFLLYPPNPWVAPAAIVLLAGSSGFWNSNMSALLDSGAMFFSTVAICGCLLAFLRPRWWYLVAFAVGLAAWQKAPIPLLFVAVMIVFAIATKKYHQVDVRTALLNRHFFAAAVIALSTIVIWPLLQWVRFGPESFQEAYVGQMVERFMPFGSEAGDGPRRSWHTILLSNEPVFRIFAILALVAMPWVLRRKELFSFPLILGLFVIMTFFATGYVSPRYSLVFMPLLAAALAVVVVKVVPGKVVPVLIIGALAMSKGGPIRSAEALGLLNSSQEKYIPLLQNVAKAMQDGESLLVCRRGGPEDRIFSGAVSYFASNGRPFREVRSANAFAQMQRQGSIAPPYRGVCSARVFDGLKELLPSYEIVEQSAGYVHWVVR